MAIDIYNSKRLGGRGIITTHTFSCQQRINTHAHQMQVLLCTNYLIIVLCLYINCYLRIILKRKKRQFKTYVQIGSTLCTSYGPKNILYRLFYLHFLLNFALVCIFSWFWLIFFEETLFCMKENHHSGSNFLS